MNDPMMAMADQYADLDRRLRTIEGGLRSGLGLTKLSGRQAGVALTNYGGNNWSTLGGLSPSVTIDTGRRVLILASFRPNNVGTPGTTVGVNDFKTNDVVMGISIDATDPQLIPSPTMRSQVAYAASPGAFIGAPATLVTFREDLVPGEHVFTMKFFSNGPTPDQTVDPVIDDMSLTIIPLGFA